MSQSDIKLIAHLMRRAGFGATRDELETYSEQGYETKVEELLGGGETRAVPIDFIRRYHNDQSAFLGAASHGAYWLYRMINTDAPLREKVSLFWACIFATGMPKLNYPKLQMDQVRMFRRYGMGNLRDLLVELSRSPAMIVWLDNHENHDGAINENYGRELLELFSMGVGNYTEQDVKECARAFTGWTIGNTDYMAILGLRNSVWPYGRVDWHFEYRPEDHDDGEKEFLGHTGRFNGEDIIDIICRQPSTARFIARHMYHFFVTDEPPVPQWPYEPPRDPEAIEELTQAYFDSGYDIGAMLRTLFNSDFFKSERCWYEKVKSPAELVAGVFRLTGEYRTARKGMVEDSASMQFMGQHLVNPPSVEGWHQGVEWIDTGTMTERLNFASQRLGNVDTPGGQAMIERIAADNGGTMSPERLVDVCLEHLGEFSVTVGTRSSLVRYAAVDGPLSFEGSVLDDRAKRRVADVLQIVAATPEFQRS
jgi:uncharacterized protein (DUF1800 family)